jgi:hypothetical protein
MARATFLFRHQSIRRTVFLPGHRACACSNWFAIPGSRVCVKRRTYVNLIILIIVLMFLFGGGGYYYGGPYVGGGLGTVLLIVLIVLLVRG